VFAIPLILALIFLRNFTFHAKPDLLVLCYLLGLLGLALIFLLLWLGIQFKIYTLDIFSTLMRLCHVKHQLQIDRLILIRKPFSYTFLDHF